MKGTFNPRLLPGLDGKLWVSYGDSTCRVSEVRPTGFGPEITIAPGGSAYPIRPGVATFVREISEGVGERLEMNIGEWQPRPVERIPGGVPFHAKDGHWLVTRPALKEVVRDGKTIQGNATGGKIDGDLVVWIQADDTSKVRHNEDPKYILQAPWPVGSMLALGKRIVVMRANNLGIRLDDGADLRVHPQGKGEGSLCGCLVNGVPWIATGCTLTNGPHIALRPITMSDPSDVIWLKRDPANLTIAQHGTEIVVISGPTSNDRLFIDRVPIPGPIVPDPGTPPWRYLLIPYSDIPHDLLGSYEIEARAREFQAVFFAGAPLSDHVREYYHGRFMSAYVLGLRQHITENGHLPGDWKPFSDAAFEDAKKSLDESF